ncbi:magnesium chelatase [Aquitalea sp. FJL05]|uniref:putative cobaltochelatase n=1 Tax=Aquitalea sp. FJL05 TaxID=2153366 RepID=UPI000F5B50A9|nr:putative cobaltochelatase [Aquitalea sp. FJL05]RQO77646.1 magnesium chelatase [Aquitalea sp. FJL05]
MKQIYPFAAIVGQPQLKQALLLCAVDPTLGGVLIRGDKGSAKSTAARGLAAILPPIRRVPGCAFNCDPASPLAECSCCQGEHAAAEDAAVPFVNLPLGASEDRVLGSLDFEQALKQGRQAFKPGLLASAHRGLLYIDEVNLLADHLVDVLLDVAAMGVNTVQREGLSISHPARITLLGTMNQEEGELRPQLLDRFGLMVDVAAPRDAAIRSEVVRRRLAFEADPQAFSARWQAEGQALQTQIGQAQSMLGAVTVSDQLFDFISQLCCEFEVASLRADIVLHKAARALAALDGRTQVSAEDIRTAAMLVLPHRRRRKPFEQSGLDQDKLDELTQQAQNPPPPAADTSPADSGQQSEQPADTPDDDNQGETSPDSGSEQVFASAAASDIGTIRLASRSTDSQASGRRSSVLNAQRGHSVRAIPNTQPQALALDATLRHALQRNPAEFAVTRADLHDKVRTAKQGNLIVLVVDASGSMAAQQRMEKVKGTVLSLLQDAYQRRDQVAVIAFRGRSAELVLPPTRQVEQAEQALHALPTGGRTPLPHALQLAGDLLARQGAQGLMPLLVLLSDGRANVALSEEADPWQQSLQLAGELAAAAIPALVLDTEQDYVKLGRARQLAEALQAEYLPCEQLSSEQLTITIQARLG